MPHSGDSVLTNKKILDVKCQKKKQNVKGNN
jgi:hypothetical protein